MTDLKTVQNVTKIFKYSFPTCTNEEVFFNLEVPVEIPHSGSTRELVQRVINMFHIPVYLEDELNEKLAKFVAEETKTFHNERDENLINQLKSCELNSEGIVKNWEKLFKENVVEFAEQKGTSDEEVFAAAYHKLVHSPALETVLQVENSYAETYNQMLTSRDEDIKQLTQQQTDEMEEAIRQLNITTSEAEINALAASQFSAAALVAGRWGSQLDALWQTQRAQCRAWLADTAQRYHIHQELHTPSNSPLGTFSAPPEAEATPPSGPAVEAETRPFLEESFTIHLGSQLKQTHNVRIVAADLLDLCALNADSGTQQSRRLQSSLSLYSNELSAVVVVVEPGEAEGAGRSPLARAAGGRVDHHFPHLDAQLEHIAERVAQPAEARNAARLAEQSGSTNRGPRSRRALAAGDVLLTRHTTLPDVHVIFHLVADPAALRPGDITSRHPAILGLRGVLRAACANDITNITLPLLLRHDLTEEMTVGWMVRRAELVLKCCKGFMLETCGGGGAELRTLTAHVPRATPPHVFATLAALLPAVFRVSNPVRIAA